MRPKLLYKILLLLMLIAPLCIMENCAQAKGKRTPENGKYGVLVLSDGAVLKGNIYRAQFGFLVRMNGGKRVVPESNVYLYTDSLQSAYDVFSKRSSKINIPARLKLAHWCLKNHLLKEAGSELKNVLVIEENNREARELLKKLEVLQDPKHPSHLLAATAHIQKKDQGSAGKSEFLGNLPRNLARTYTAKVQPILLNKCGNVSCHGSDKRKFYLHPDTVKIRRFSNQNIKSVYNQINWSSPEKSPLLSSHPVRQGVKNNRGYFRGRSGVKQKALIQKWIIQVSEYRDKNDQLNSEDHKQVVQTSYRTSDKSDAADDGPQKNTKKPLLMKVLKSERKDLFSPNEFNRQYHDR